MFQFAFLSLLVNLYIFHQDDLGLHFPLLKWSVCIFWCSPNEIKSYLLVSAIRWRYQDLIFLFTLFWSILGTSQDLHLRMFFGRVLCYFVFGLIVQQLDVGEISVPRPGLELGLQLWKLWVLQGPICWFWGLLLEIWNKMESDWEMLFPYP